MPLSDTARADREAMNLRLVMRSNARERAALGGVPSHYYRSQSHQEEWDARIEDIRSGGQDLHQGGESEFFGSGDGYTSATALDMPLRRRFKVPPPASSSSHHGPLYAVAEQQRGPPLLLHQPPPPPSSSSSSSSSSSKEKKDSADTAYTTFGPPPRLQNPGFSRGTCHVHFAPASDS
jgi:hypothetical protein